MNLFHIHVVIHNLNDLFLLQLVVMKYIVRLIYNLNEKYVHARQNIHYQHSVQTKQYHVFLEQHKNQNQFY
jgi:hypothetical protein